MRVLGVGVATLDVVNEVAAYPLEDDEVRASAQRIGRGGNATNTLVVLSQLGHACDWAGTLSDEPSSRDILDDLARHGVGTHHVQAYPGGRVPTSYVTLSLATGSRTIVHHRDLPEYPAEAFAELPLEQYDWVHFEGRAVRELRQMIGHLRTVTGPRSSLEVEKPRDGIEACFEGVDLLLFGRQYVRHRGYDAADAFLSHAVPEGPLAFCAWGEQGAWARDARGALHHAPAWAPAEVVDTLGAGDVFNAAVIDGWSRGRTLPETLAAACCLAGVKCTRRGLDDLLIS